jgi:hexose kinase, 1-phosphofructokinase family
MILCITPNPALDRTLIVPNLALGNVHRAQQLIVAAGGKGLNVARAAQTLGRKSLCMGFAGGHSGHLLADLAQSEGLNSSWTWTDSETRTCTILVSQNGDATEIDEPGLPISDADWARLRGEVQKQLSPFALICVSGSLPPNSSVDDLHELLRMLMDAGKQVWVDTSGTSLDAVLTYPGICIKVNGNEMSKSLGFEVKDIPSAQRALTLLIERGLSACAITLGAAGALLATKAGRWYAQGPQVRAISSVGSGDSFLGGLLSARDADKDWPEALLDAVAAGTANTLSAGGGQFTVQEFRRIREQARIQTW